MHPQPALGGRESQRDVHQVQLDRIGCAGIDRAGQPKVAFDLIARDPLLILIGQRADHRRNRPGQVPPVQRALLQVQIAHPGDAFPASLAGLLLDGQHVRVDPRRQRCIVDLRNRRERQVRIDLLHHADLGAAHDDLRQAHTRRQFRIAPGLAQQGQNTYLPRRVVSLDGQLRIVELDLRRADAAGQSGPRVMAQHHHRRTEERWVAAVGNVGADVIQLDPAKEAEMGVADGHVGIGQRAQVPLGVPPDPLVGRHRPVAVHHGDQCHQSDQGDPPPARRDIAPHSPALARQTTRHPPGQPAGPQPVSQENGHDGIIAAHDPSASLAWLGL